MKTATNTASKQFAFFVVESDDKLGAPIGHHGTVSVSYTNYYNDPRLIDAPYDYNRPPFASYSSIVAPAWSLESTGAFTPTVYVVAHLSTQYKSSSGADLATQSLQYSGFGNTVNGIATSSSPYTIDTMPYCAVNGAGASAQYSTQSISLQVTTYFD